MANGKEVAGSVWFYAPSQPAAIIFTILFFLSSAVHIWQTSRYKCWKLTPLFPVGTFLFFTGFALRSYGAFHYDNLNIYIASICITYAAPPFLELQNYRVLGRILYYVPYHAPLPPRQTLLLFGGISILIEVLNGTGAVRVADSTLSSSEMKAGQALIKTCLLLQLVELLCFLGISVTFHRRCAKHGLRNKRLQTPLCTMYVSTALILVRCIYRTVEYFSVSQVNWHNTTNPNKLSAILRYEWFFYVFEAVPMFCNCVLFNVFHPRRFLPVSNDIYLAEDGVTEVETPAEEKNKSKNKNKKQSTTVNEAEDETVTETGNGSTKKSFPIDFSKSYTYRGVRYLWLKARGPSKKTESLSPQSQEEEQVV